MPSRAQRSARCSAKLGVATIVSNSPAAAASSTRAVSPGGRNRTRRAPVRSTEPCVCPATNGPAPSDPHRIVGVHPRRPIGASADRPPHLSIERVEGDARRPASGAARLVDELDVAWVDAQMVAERGESLFRVTQVGLRAQWEASEIGDRRDGGQLGARRRQLPANASGSLRQPLADLPPHVVRPGPLIGATLGLDDDA